LLSEIIADLIIGFQGILHWEVLLMIPFGVMSGIIIGALPGFTVMMGVALLAPLTFFMDPVAGLVFLIGIYKGGIYGGSITAIVISTPGTPAAAATVADGSQLAKKGHAGKAMEMALYSSVLADSFSDIVLILVCVPLARVALKFSSPEFFALLFFSLIMIGGLTGKSLFKGLLSMTLGLFLGCIGLDPILGTPRLNFGIFEITAGVSLMPFLIGLYGMSEILSQGEKKLKDHWKILKTEKVRDKLSFSELLKHFKTIFKSALIGTFIGILPGIGSSVAAFMAYGEAKRSSKNPEKFGKGSLEGIAAAEAGNNAVCGATFIPLFTFGIPGDAVTAVMLVAFIAQGLRPGPRMLIDHREIMYMILTGLFLCNFANLIMGKIAIKYFYKPLSSLPSGFVYPVVLVLCFFGTYAVNNSMFDLLVLVLSGFLGYLMKKNEFPFAPAIIAFLLGARLESNFRRALLMSEGNYLIFIQRPISLFFLILSVILLIYFAKREKLIDI